MPAPLTIVDLQARVFRAATTDGVGMAFAPLTHRSTVLVEVYSASGLVGRGESWVNFPPWAAQERLATLGSGVAPLVIGREADDPAAIAAIFDSLMDALWPMARQWGAPGPIMQAISGVDIALWDLLARSRGVPVADLLGGRLRSRVPVYASSLGPTDVVADARRCVEAGHRWVKVKLGFGAEVDRANLVACRAAVGPQVTIVADANQAWTLEQAISASSMLTESGVAWIEEPLQGDRLDELEELVGRTGLTVATGENIYRLAGFAPYLESPQIGVYQPDVTKTGGITETVRICRAAAAAGRVVMPHVYGGAVALAASLQIAAALAAVERVEFDVRSNPLRDPVVREPFRLAEGMVDIPDGPGLGVELDEAALQPHWVASLADADTKGSTR